MKLSPKELDRLEKVCRGMSRELTNSIVFAYYKEKLARLNPKINKSHSYKQENKLSNSAAILELVKSVR